MDRPTRMEADTPAVRVGSDPQPGPDSGHIAGGGCVLEPGCC